MGYTTKQKFWEKVALPDSNGCMLWLGTKQKEYGLFRVSGKSFRASRLSLIIADGLPISQSMEAAHGCRNKDCVAPAHLSWKTAAGNAEDRDRDGTTVRGERHYKAKLTTGKVETIRALYRSGEFTQSELARSFKVAHSTIGRIVTEKTWRT